MSDRTCSVEGCDKSVKSRGWCNTHYERWRLRGKPDDPIRPTLEQRLWSKIDCSSDCWLWTASTNTKGYGQIKFKGTMLRVPRVVWELTHGPIPPGMFVCHRCDNPPCCRPEHLFLGSPADNMTDKMAKGRGRVGTALAPDIYAVRMKGTHPKICGRCKQMKDPEGFGPNASQKDGLQTYCKSCLGEYRRQRAQAARPDFRPWR